MVNKDLVKSGLLMFVILLSACTSTTGRDLLGNAIGSAANTQVGYNKHQCFKIKSQCVQGHYEEWQTSDGVPGCSCKEY